MDNHTAMRIAEQLSERINGLSVEFLASRIHDEKWHQVAAEIERHTAERIAKWISEGGVYGQAIAGAIRAGNWLNYPSRT